MMLNPFKKQERSIKRQMQGRKKLLASFVKIHGSPVIVHAIHDKEVFHKVLQDGKLKLPNNHKSLQKTPYMERLLGIDNCIYYSLGFVYFSSYKWKYNLIFDIKYLKNLIYYNNSVNFQAAKAVVSYWYEQDRTYLEKLANTNKITRTVIDKYYYKKYNGKGRKILEFWKIEKELFDSIFHYSHKKALISLIKNVEKKHFLKYPASKKDALACYLEEKAPEMVGKKENNLLKNPYFIGFYISGAIDKKILTLLKEKYSDKILFNGKEINKISRL